MKVARLTDLDYNFTFPISKILKVDSQERTVGCCPLSLFNFFGLTEAIEGFNSEFLLWLQRELNEDEKTLITPTKNFLTFLENPIFNKLEIYSGAINDVRSEVFIEALDTGWIMFAVIYKGKIEPAHCVVFHCANQVLHMDGEVISTEKFNEIVYGHKYNAFMLGHRKGEVIPRP